jgi:NAD(P)-dependent dehydrogenase (short-subunit alcohol dehydrogenase family)
MILRDRVAVITGAGRGIGAEAARLFAQEGARVAVVDSDATSAASVARSILEGHAFSCDVRQEQQVEETVAAIAL